MKKLTIILFSVCIFGLLVFLGINVFFGKSDNTSSRPQVVLPIVNNESTNVSDAVQIPAIEVQPSVFIPIMSNETVLSVEYSDINSDGYEDQMVLLRRSGTMNLVLLAGLYNSATSTYERSAEIQTEVSQANSFSFSILDITGEHINSVTYTGINENSETVFKAYLPASSAGTFWFTPIAEFTSDGTIFIQTLQRFDSYYYSQVHGDSFPIWVYSTDSSADNETLNQIQTQYNWSAEAQKYVKVSESKISGKILEAEERSRIQDGTPETFKKFLNGLWYKPHTDGQGIQYVFFDVENEEIVFLYNDIQEVFLWGTSMLRRSGMYIVGKNTEVNNFTRRIDIALVSSDEIRLKVNEDVAIIIQEDNIWDGNYQKVGEDVDVVLGNSTKKLPAASMDYLETNNGVLWVYDDDTTITMQDNRYTVNKANEELDSGTVSFTELNTGKVLQFRSASGSNFFNGNYSINISQDSPRNGTVRETLELSAVTLSSNELYFLGLEPIVVHRNQKEDDALTAAILGIK